MFSILLGILLGVGVSFQTAINAKLRSFLNAPFLASFVSFSVGTLTLLLATATHSTQPLSGEMLEQAVWWSWLGGLLGMLGLTGNILLFPKLGAVQTAVMPIFGQILMAMLIDHFGWFNAPIQPFSLIRLLGVVLVLSGIFCAVVLPSIKQKNSGNPAFLWQLLGVGVGILLAAQTAINAQLAQSLHSPLYAALVSFLVGASGLFFVILCYEKSFARLKNTLGRNKPIWIWCGGSLGAAFIFGSVLLVPQIGTGGVVLLFLLGLISGSLAVDNFGWFGAAKKQPLAIQFIGLGLLFGGVGVIRFL